MSPDLNWVFTYELEQRWPLRRDVRAASLMLNVVFVGEMVNIDGRNHL